MVGEPPRKNSQKAESISSQHYISAFSEMILNDSHVPGAENEAILFDLAFHFEGPDLGFDLAVALLPCFKALLLHYGLAATYHRCLQ